jgi:hypothetical protein
MAQIYLKHLGLADKNSNGVIDRGAGEGYEAFTAQYGNADIGFYANGVTQSAKNGKLEEPEIINHYYIKLRFKPKFQQETAAIESEIKAYIYANNIPLVWLDDQQGTLVNAINEILGEGWNERKVSEDKAKEMFHNVIRGLEIYGLPGDPFITGYYQLPELIENPYVFCFETAEFYFWFLSELGINSVVVRIALPDDPPEYLLHDAVKLTGSNQILDYFEVSTGYRIPNKEWQTQNPLQSLSEYYVAQAKKEGNTEHLKQAAIYNRYDFTNIGLLIKAYYDDNTNYDEIIALGEHILQNTDIKKIINAKHLEATQIKNNFKGILLFLIGSYFVTGNLTGFNTIERLLNQYFRKDPIVKSYLDYYNF